MKPWLLGLVGLLIVVVAFFTDFLLLTNPVIRNEYWTYALILPGIALAVVGLVRERAAATWTLAVLAALAGVGYSIGRFMPVPSTPPVVKILDYFPDFMLPDQTGQRVTFSDLRRDGPVVVVIYRGGW